MYAVSTLYDIRRIGVAIMGGLDDASVAQRLNGPRTFLVRLGPPAAALLTIALVCCFCGTIAPAGATPPTSSADGTSSVADSDWTSATYRPGTGVLSPNPPINPA